MQMMVIHAPTNIQPVKVTEERIGKGDAKEKSLRETMYNLQFK